MSFNLRDAQVTVIHIDETTVRGIKGQSELFRRPSVTIRARYAIPLSPINGDVVAVREANASSESANGGPSSHEGRSGWLVGEQLDAAETSGKLDASWEVRWPFSAASPSDQGETSRAGALTNGKQNKEDWEGREFILKHMYDLLDIKLATNNSPLMLIPPAPLTLDASALFTQIAFEILNVPGLTILPSPTASLFALGATSGLVLQCGRDSSTVSVVTDSICRDECTVTVDVGLSDCQKWFNGLLMRDEGLDRELRNAVGVQEWGEGQKARLIREVGETVWRECTGQGDLDIPMAGGQVSNRPAGDEEDEQTFDVAKKLVGEPAVPQPTVHKKKPPAAQTQAATTNSDLISISLPSLPGKEIPLGPVRHRLCEPLFRGKPGGGESAWEGMGRAVDSPALSQWEKLSIWDGIGVVGEVSRIKTFGPALMTYLSPFLLSSDDLPSDIQPAKARLLSIPDYFANFKGATSELAPFLGGSMVAKYAFTDYAGKHCITKPDYNAKGPAAIYTAGIGEDR